MPLQNRVTPDGSLIAVAARGTLTGNRGVLHDAAQRIRRRWTTRAWIACRLEFRGRHRAPMPPGRWTALFFLDEATALAAGHRPCGECRHADYRAFVAAWQRANGALTRPLAPSLDRALHADRLAADRTRRWFSASLAELPDGVMVRRPDAADDWLLWQGALHRWTPSGYDRSLALLPAARVDVLTPRSIVAAIAAGYRPAVHPTLTMTAPSA